MSKPRGNVRWIDLMEKPEEPSSQCEGSRVLAGLIGVGLGILSCLFWKWVWTMVSR